MINSTPLMLILAGFLLFGSSCYVDDTSANPVPPLPFENFDAFFETSRLEADTFSIEASENEIIVADRGSVVTIADDSFSLNDQTVEGPADVIVKEFNRKSEMVLADLPSASGNEILELGAGIFYTVFQGDQQLELESSLALKLPLSEQLSSTDDLSLYLNNGDWNSSNTTLVFNSADQSIQFETGDPGWHAGFKVLDVSDFTHTSAVPTGFGGTLTDLRGFIVFSDYNTVLRMESDFNTLTLMHNDIPKGLSVTVVILAMDRFRLLAGMAEVTVSEGMALEIEIDEMSTGELKTLLETLD